MAPRDGRDLPPATTGTVELGGAEALATSWFPGEDDSSDATPITVSPRPRYVLLEPVGAGAMGTVHRARDLDLRRTVAFKLARQGATAETRRRLLTEVQVTAQLDHPSVVPVHGLEPGPAGEPGYVMKLVEGRTLTQVLDEARRQHQQQGTCDHQHDLAARLEIFLRVCDALSYAHSKGVVHRDIKPPNVMVGRFGEVYLMDWGIARVLGHPDQEPTGEAPLDLDGAVDRTRVGQVFGTPAYMAPEQARGEADRVGPPADVYALGLLLYELCVLRRANRAEGEGERLAQAREGRSDPPTPPEGCPPPPRELLAIAARAAAPRIEERYPSVVDLAEDVQRFLRGEETRALPDRAHQRAARWLSRRQGLLLAMVALVLVLGAAAVAGTWALHQQRLGEQALQSQERQARISELVWAVDGRARRIDQHFLWVEGQLDGLAAAALYAFTRGTPTDRPTYSAADYAAGRTPPDMVPSIPYGKPVSTGHAVYTVAPSVPASTWQQDLARADGLREHLHQMLLASPPGQPDRGQTPEAQWVANRGNPIVWAYVALEQSGLMYMSPGAAGWDDQYDPRTRPWYRVNLGVTGNVWGTPYVDLMGQGRLLSATRSLTLPDGTFLGVAGVDLLFEDVVERLVAAPELPGFRTAYLVDGQGRVMVESAARDLPVVVPATEVLDPGIDFGPARRPEVRAAAIAGKSGQAEVVEGELTLMVSWAHLDSLGWTYVVETDRDAWLADAR
ncbi:serine/threonine protein kinase [Myxococcota bacterium]|nr:serine/threonine protein kinase [Myxococcota bacterium]